MTEKLLTPAEYKFAAEQMAACLLNGIGVCYRYKEQHPVVGNMPPYELNGWLQHATELTCKWFKVDAVSVKPSERA